MKSDGSSSDPTHFYRVEVKGHLARDWSEWLDGLTITNLSNGNTALSGHIVDQAALHGLINRVFALGLSLVAVNQENRTSKGGMR